jgi:hypothetical protein
MRVRPSRLSAADDGFSLLEALVATSIMTVGVAALAQIAGWSLYANTQVAANEYRVRIGSAEGRRARCRGRRRRIGPSPAGTLKSDVAATATFVDRAGRPLGAGPAPPDSAYARRWSIEPLPASPAHTSILQVLVIDQRHHATVTPCQPTFACLATRGSSRRWSEGAF